MGQAQPTLLILSAGSLVAQNILDAVGPRRRELRVLGVNLDAENPRLFRCDEVWLVPPVESEAALEERLLKLIATERPDLMVPGRDHDVVFLAKLRERHPELAGCIPCGSLKAARTMQDKYLSCLFARDRRLPFADTLPISPESGRESVGEWVQRHSFPFIAKPRSGFGSKGIRLILDQAQLDQLLRRQEDCLLQEYVGPDRDFDAMREIHSLGIPWFHSIPEEAQYAGQTIIDPSGHVGPLFCSVNTMVLGRCEASSQANDAVLAKHVRAYAEAFAEAGWRGSLNVQFQRNGSGEYKAHEMNGRMTGSTSARRLMGFDEISLLFELFPGKRLAPIPAPLGHGAGRVLRSLTDMCLAHADAAALAQEGHWARGQTAAESLP
jgi:carbamoyl-phosphate synthase large subunit